MGICRKNVQMEHELEVHFSKISDPVPAGIQLRELYHVPTCEWSQQFKMNLISSPAVLSNFTQTAPPLVLSLLIMIMVATIKIQITLRLTQKQGSPFSVKSSWVFLVLLSVLFVGFALSAFPSCSQKKSIRCRAAGIRILKTFKSIISTGDHLTFFLLSGWKEVRWWCHYSILLTVFSSTRNYYAYIVFFNRI